MAAHGASSGSKSTLRCVTHTLYTCLGISILSRNTCLSANTSLYLKAKATFILANWPDRTLPYRSYNQNNFNIGIRYHKALEEEFVDKYVFAWQMLGFSYFNIIVKLRNYCLYYPYFGLLYNIACICRKQRVFNLRRAQEGGSLLFFAFLVKSKEFLKNKYTNK